MLLPVEIKLNIADYLDPLSSINFGISCKEHWRLCQPLFRKHTQAYIDAPVVTGDEIWALLRDVLKDPSKGWYITEISLTSSWEENSPESPIEDVEQLQSSVRALWDLYPLTDTNSEEDSIVERIESGIAVGSIDSAMAILAHHLPNVKTLRMTMGLTWETATFEVLLQRVAREYRYADKVSDLPFGRLRTVALSHHDSESCFSPDWVLHFLHFPSLRTFAGCMVGGTFYDRYTPSWSLLDSCPQTDVEEFIFINSQLEASVLEFLLSRTRHLKRFVYNAGGAIINDSRYEAKRILNALEDHARHSLECLVLSHISYKEEEEIHHCFSTKPLEADLSMFTKLHSISANWAMLWPEMQHLASVSERIIRAPQQESSCTLFDIRDILPKSLAMLQLGGEFSEEEWEGVIGPLGTFNEQTPYLTKNTMRVEGRIKVGRDVGLGEGVIASVGGWSDRDEKRVFGEADRAWLKFAWAAMKLFDGHGW